MRGRPADLGPASALPCLALRRPGSQMSDFRAAALPHLAGTYDGRVPSDLAGGPSVFPEIPDAR